MLEYINQPKPIRAFQKVLQTGKIRDNTDFVPGSLQEFNI